MDNTSGDYSQYIDFVREQIKLCPQSQEAIRKLETCKHKSDSSVTGEFQACCGGIFLTEGLKCLKLNIFPLDFRSCHECKSYEQK